MNTSQLILAISLAVQGVNVLLAVRLILRTRNYLAGTLIISAVALMAFRRAIALYRFLESDLFRTDIIAESVALAISFLFLIGIIFATRLIEAEIRARREKEQLISELSTALAEIKTLKGIVPICSSCKKIRDDQGYWNYLEQYLREHSAAEFSHCICPDCAAKLYPGYASRLNEVNVAKSGRNPEDEQ